MSEYQYYEFQAVDRPLTAEEMLELRAVSTRARITSTHFVNEYGWGDFKGRPDPWMERYFDAFLYLASWGSRPLMLRLPRGRAGPGSRSPGQDARAWAHDGFVILSFDSEEAGGDSRDDDGSGWLASILPLRAEIAGGDHRALYLAWLPVVQQAHTDEGESRT